LTLSEFTWQRSRLGNVDSAVVLKDGHLRLPAVNGSLGQGIVSGEVGLNLTGRGRGWFRLDLDRVEAATLLGPWLPSPDAVQGPVQVRLRGRLDGSWVGTADLELSRGRVFGVDVTEWHLPVTWEFSPHSGHGKAGVAESSGQAGHGRFTARATLRWGESVNLEGQVRFQGVELRSLLRQAESASEFGAGKITGHFDFAGADLRSPDDLTGFLEASFSQTQALQFPVLRDLTRFLRVSPNTTFDGGSVRARLGRGVVRVERLSLEGELLRLYCDGTATLQGRLNLNVLATTGRVGLGLVRLQLLGLHVTGTVRSPTTQVLPVAEFPQEAIRFFLGR
jgi:hypothetical protein